MHCVRITLGWVRELSWTDESLDHIWERHQVQPEEVEQVVYFRYRWVKRGRGGVQEVHGRTDAGRYLIVFLSESEDGGDHVVTARDMDKTERRNFCREGR